MAAIHQIVAGFTNGDAISNEALRFKSIFHSWGFESKIFSESKRVLPELRKTVEDFTKSDSTLNHDDIIMLHLSIGSPVNDYFKKLNCRKVIRYHNITPYQYFKLINQNTARSLEKGREQLARLSDAAELNLAVSEFNAKELRNRNFSNVHVLPIFLDLEKIKTSPDKRILSKYSDKDIFNIIFVGRCAPNKKIEDLIRLMAFIKKTCTRKIRLIHVGSYAGTEHYYHILLSMRHELGLDNEVIFAGSVSQRELSAYYKTASLFLCMSEHEGFCLPLIEAMIHKIPVIAYNAGAIAETMDGTGVLFKTKNFPLITETIRRIMTDKHLKDAIVSKQNMRIGKYSSRDLSHELKLHFKQLRQKAG